MEKHIQALHAQKVEDATYSMVQDDFLCIRDVLSIGKKLAIEKYQLHDMTSKVCGDGVWKMTQVYFYIGTKIAQMAKSYARDTESLAAGDVL
ncbi:hypothetical protein GOP47_0001329 [Adiantum capillus-veneris]|uniref:Uncharacterized protein n=1 Tax=Adiantum capillus-veneris TaxID=13818 RepID=A0A9D4V818_ADICA|nr:hypothetical protein GOP47_0001329 [Adiantum capillus-veneris]